MEKMTFEIDEEVYDLIKEKYNEKIALMVANVIETVLDYGHSSMELMAKIYKENT